MYKVLVVLLLLHGGCALASDYPSSESPLEVFDRTRLAFEKEPSAHTFVCAYDAAGVLLDEMGARNKACVRSLLDDVWQDRGDWADWQVHDGDGPTAQDLEKKLLKSFSQQTLLLMTLGYNPLDNIDHELSKRYGPFGEVGSVTCKDQAYTAFSCDGNFDNRLMGGRRVDLLLTDTACASFKQYIEVMNTHRDVLIPVWRWKELFCHPVIANVEEGFWKKLHVLPCGLRNFLWGYGKPEATEKLVDFHDTFLPEMAERGMDVELLESESSAFLSLLRMGPDDFSQNMNTVRAFSTSLSRKGMPWIDEVAFNLSCQQSLSFLESYEKLSSFVWSVDKVFWSRKIKGDQAQGQDLSRFKQWSACEGDVTSWLSFRMISRLNAVLDEHFTHYIGMLECVGHSKYDWVFGDMYSQETEEIFDTYDTDTDSDEGSDNDGGGAPIFNYAASVA